MAKTSMDDQVPCEGLYEEREEEDDQDDRTGRFCDAFVNDFEGTSTLIMSSLENAAVHESPSALGIVETLTEIVRNGEAWLPAETSERVESELVPHAVQLLLANAVEGDEAVDAVASFLTLVLERTAQRLLYCDACLLPSLVRILDVRRAFYESTQSEETPPVASVYVDVEEILHVSPLYLRNVANWGDLGGFTLLLRCLQASSARAKTENDAEEEEVADSASTKENEKEEDGTIDVDEDGVFAFDAIQCIYRVLYAVKDHVSRAFLTEYLVPLTQSSRIYIATVTTAELGRLPRDSVVEIVHIVDLVVSRIADTQDENANEMEETTAMIQEAQVGVELLRLDLMLRFFTSPSLEKRIYGLVEMMDVLSKASVLHAEYFALWIQKNRLSELLFGETKHPELIKRCLPLLRFVMSTADERATEWLEAIWGCFMGKSRLCTNTSVAAGAAINDVVRGSTHSLLLEIVGFTDCVLLRHLLMLSKSPIPNLDSDVITLLSAVAKKIDTLRDPVLLHLWEYLLRVDSLASTVVADQALEEISAIIDHALEEEPFPYDDCLVTTFLGRCIDSIESSTSNTALQPLRLVEKLGALVHQRVLRIDRAMAKRLVPSILKEMESFKEQSPVGEQADDSVAESYLNGIRVQLLALRSAMIIAEVAGVAGQGVVDALWDSCVLHARQTDESALFFQWVEYCFRTHIETPTDGSNRLVSEDVALHLVETKFQSLPSSAMMLSALCCFHHLFRKINCARGGLAFYNADGEPIEDKQDEQEEAEDTEGVSDLMTGKPMVGMSGLWHLALHTTDEVAAEEAITLLARHHLDFVPALRESNVAQATKRAFVEACVSHLTIKEGDASSSALVNRCLDCLRYFLDASQADKESSVSPVEDRVDNQRLDKYALENLEQKLQALDIYPSPMKDIASAGESSVPTMLYAGPRRPSWNFKQHHALLEAIQDDGDDLIGSPERGDADDETTNTKRSPVRRGELTIEIPPMERRLSIDTSVAGSLRPTQRTKSPSVQSRPDLQWIHGSQAASSQGPEFVIEGFEVDTTTDPSVDSVPQLLVSRGQFVDTLFDLVRSEEAETSRRAWGLLCQLPISTDVLRRMVRLRPVQDEGTDAAEVSWSELLDCSCVYRLLYSLRLVEALLMPFGAEKKSEDGVKRQWRERFARLGGVSHLLALAETLCYHVAGDESCVVTLACIGSVARVLSYFAQLSHPSVASKVDSSSPFDSRLVRSTLPSCLSGSDSRLEAVVTAAVGLVSALTHFTAQTREIELAATSVVELICSLVPLNPSIAKTTIESKHDGGIFGWLQSVFILANSPESRAKVVSFLSSIAPAAGLREDSDAFTAAVLQRSLDIAFGRKDGGSVSTELLELVVDLSTLLTRSPALVRWILDLQVIPCLLTKIETQSCLSDLDEALLRGYLHVLGSVSSQAPSLKRAVLSFQPASDTRSHDQGSWIVELISSRILWTTSTIDEDVPRGVRDATTRQAAHKALLRLAFDSSDPTPELTVPTLRSLSRFQAQVQSQLVNQGRPWHFTPSDELQDPAEVAFAGLVNPGCVCYMNSLMQQLFMMPAFRDGLFSVDTSVSRSGNSWQDEVAELQKLFVSLACSDRKALDPTPFALSHRDLDGNPTDLNLQMDADEFFCMLLDRVETFVHQQQAEAKSSNPSTAVKNATTPATSFLDRCFGGVLVNQILTEHGQLSEREEKFFALSLDISQKQQLTESLSLYVQGETLEGDNAYYCEHAKKKVSATKRVCIKKLPQTLVCHLKRFEFDFDTMEKIKIHDYLAFPDEIDMFPYTSEALANANSERGLSSCMYELVGIVVHSGTSDMGHYYSFIKDRSATADSVSETPAWFEFNDQTVKPFDVATMGDECFGGEEITQKWDHGARAYVPVVQRKRRSAYMLIYQQRHDQAKSVADEAAAAVSSPVVFDWKSAPASAQQLKRLVDSENQELHNVVHAASEDHAQFLASMVEAATITKREDHGPEENEDDDDVHVSEDSSRFTIDDFDQPQSADVMAAVVACEHVFGVSTLLSSDDDTSVARILHAVEMWLSSASANQSEPLEREKLQFCEWLLRKVTKTEPAPSERSVVRRSWLFDLLFFCDKRPSLVQSCSSLLLQCLRVLSASDEGRHHHRAPADFLQFLVELFFDREDIQIADPASGSVFPVPQASIIHATTLIGTFLKDCVAVDDENEANCVLRDLFLNESGFVDRFLFSLQAHDSPTSGVAPLTSRVRSSTFSIERQLLHDALTALPRTNGSVPEDPRLLLNQSVFKNMLTFQFDEAMTPLIVHLARKRLTRMQSDKLVSMLLAVLEEVKSTYLEQLLELFGALMDTPEPEKDSQRDSDVSPLQQHILSPTNGLLEAAAYYRDHRTLHEYAFLLVEFAISRVASSASLQRYFQHKEGVADQVAWVKDWLIGYLDPNHSIRSSGEVVDDKDASESAVLHREVRALFVKAERGFGFKIFEKSNGELSRQQQAEVGDEYEEQVEETKLSAVESLEDSDLCLSSDSENQDDDDEDNVHDAARSLQVAKGKKEVELLGAETKTRLANPWPQVNVEEDVDTSSSSSFVVRAHMSSAA